jgi:hypothetical protein
MKTIKLTENNLNYLIKKIMSEQNIPDRDYKPNPEQGEFSPFSTRDRGDVSQDAQMSREIKLGNALFKLGSSVVNTNSQEFIRAKDLFSKSEIKKAVITPGVSAVSYRGESATGPKNIALGQNRAKSFIAALKNAVPNLQTEFSIKQTVVGTNTIPNSEGANAEQYVNIAYTTSENIEVPQPPIDNTGVVKKPYVDNYENELIPIPISKESSKICLQITVYNRNVPRLLEQIKMIKRFGTVKKIKCP